MSTSICIVPHLLHILKKTNMLVMWHFAEMERDRDRERDREIFKKSYFVRVNNISLQTSFFHMALKNKTKKILKVNEEKKKRTEH